MIQPEHPPFEHPEELPPSGEPFDLRQSLSELLGELEQANTTDHNALVNFVLQQGGVTPGIPAARGVITGREQIIRILKAHLEMSGPEADAYIQEMLSEEPRE